MSERKLSTEIISVLEKACGDNIGKYEIVIHEDDTSGEGYIGEMIFVSLINKTTNDKLHVLVKHSHLSDNPSAAEIVNATYFNEIYFYENIWTALEKFQRSFTGVTIFDKIPKCYAVQSDVSKHFLVLENLKNKGFEMFKRDAAFEDTHVKFLLKLYGIFHGISAAFREYDPKEFKELTSKLTNSSKCFFNLNSIKILMYVFTTQTSLFITDEKIKEKLQDYVKNGPQIAIEALKYRGRNPVMLHGDCWSNNYMFKFDTDGNPIDVRFLDFQFCRVGTVVTDLSYLIYAGSTKDILSNLDYYLKIYYGSFADTLHSFKLELSEIFTFEDLKEEWKHHCSIGFVMSQLLWRVKISKSYEKRSLVELEETLKMDEDVETVIEKTMQAYQIDPIRVKEIFVDLVNHMYENDYF